MVDRALEDPIQPFFFTENQHADDSTAMYTNNRMFQTGRFDQHANFDGPQNYIITNYTATVGYSSEIALSVFKLGQNYVLGWNIQTDFKDL